MTDQQTSRTNITEALRELIRVSKSAGMNAASDFGYLPSQQQADEEEISEVVQLVYAALAAEPRSDALTAPDEPSTLAALQRMADPLDAVVVPRRAWREARAASASVPPGLSLAATKVVEQYQQAIPFSLVSEETGLRDAIGELEAVLRSVEVDGFAAETPEQGRGDE